MATEIKVSKPQDFILNSTASINLFLCGVGTGKTFTLAVQSAYFFINYPFFMQIIAANTYLQLSTSTISACMKVWKNIFGLVKDVHYVVGIIPPKNFKIINQQDKYEKTISFINGALIFTRSLDRAELIDGMEAGVGFLDETKDSKEDAVVKTILTRLRQTGLWLDKNGKPSIIDTGLKGYNPMFCFTSPAKTMWLTHLFKMDEMEEAIEAEIYKKDGFFSYNDGLRCVVIASTFHNEENLPRGWIEERIKLFGNDQEKINRLIYGSPLAKTGGEFIRNFNKITHVKPIKLNHDLPIHMTIDINYHPYMSGLYMQIEYKEDLVYLNILGESALREPGNKMEDLAMDAELRFIHKASGFYYYGDASGKNRQTLTKEYANYYSVIENKLQKYLNSDSDRVLHKNPSVSKTRDAVDAALTGNNGFVITIDPSCKEFINDLIFCKMDANGNMTKPKSKDAFSGVVCELRGHHVDAFRYMFHYLFGI